MNKIKMIFGDIKIKIFLIGEKCTGKSLFVSKIINDDFY